MSALRRTMSGLRRRDKSPNGLPEQLSNWEMTNWQSGWGEFMHLNGLQKIQRKDHGPIMEVLTAYVREEAPRKEEDTQNGAKKLPADIQAILTVIGRRETTGKNRGNDSLDLSCTRLVRADLTDANLVEAILVEADLRQADLTRANLARAKLFRANLTEANLTEANLTEAKHLTANQVRETIRWREAYLPDSLKDILEPPA